MTNFHCSPEKPWGIHPPVRNDEECVRCGWNAPGPKSDARREAEALAAEHGWALIEGGVHDAPADLPETRAA